MLRYFILTLFFFLTGFQLFAQEDSIIWDHSLSENFNFIHINDNIITRSSKLDSVWRKLVKIKRFHKGKVTIVHIGDSHIQADGITAVLRNGFHQFFGNAGRGLVFPYQLAGSNAPPDVSSSSNISWDGNRLVNSEKNTRTGISGFGIKTTKKMGSSG